MKYLYCLTVTLVLAATGAYAQQAAPAATQEVTPLVPAATPMLAMPAEPAEPAPVATPSMASDVPAAAAATEQPVASEPAADPAPMEASPAAAAPEEKVMPKRKPRPKPAPVASVPITPFGSEGSGAIPALPLDIMTNGNVMYVTGGIGDEELEMLKSHDNEFNVHLLLSASSGEYISDVLVRVLNEQGQEVLSVPNAGPYLYVKLPPGKYTLEGTATQGGIKSVKVNAPASGYAKAHIVYIE